jgi:hypothetical protein
VQLIEGKRFFGVELGVNQFRALVVAYSGQSKNSPELLLRRSTSWTELCKEIELGGCFCNCQ